MLKIWKELREPFGICLLNSTAQFEWNLQHIFFNHFIKNPKTTDALTFLTHDISAIGGVIHTNKIAILLLQLMLMLHHLYKELCTVVISSKLRGIKIGSRPEQHQSCQVIQIAKIYQLLKVCNFYWIFFLN